MDRFLAPSEGHAVRLLPAERGADTGWLRRADGRLVRGTDEARYSTPELLALERRALDGALARRDDAVAVVDDAQVGAALARRPALSEEQRDMVGTLTRSGAGVDVVVGKAGSGKTFPLDAAREAWQAAGIPVLGCALAARAAAGLQDGTGIPSGTLDALLTEIDRHDASLAAHTVVIVDEAGMVGTRTLARLLDHAEAAAAKVVLVGDHRQLPEIDAGGVFRGLAARLPALELVDNRRQQQSWERDALDELRDGDATAGLAAFAAHGRITTGDTADAVRDRLVDDWWRAQDPARVGEAGVMRAARRIDVDDLNARARRRLQAAGMLNGATVTVDEREYAIGDRVLCTRNDRRVGVVNGDLATVTAVDPGARTVTVRCDRDEASVDLPGRYVEAGHLTHAYAMTAHKAQGATVESAWVLGSDACYREWSYVALSRARTGSRLYLVGDTDGTSYGFADAIQHSRAHHLATEQGEPAAAPVTNASGATSPMATAQRRSALLAYALQQAREGHQLAERRLATARNRLDQQRSGLRRFSRGEATTRLRRDVVRFAGDVAAWQNRLYELTGEHTKIHALQARSNLDETTAGSIQVAVAEPTPTRDTTAARRDQLQEQDGWDVGIA